MAESFYCVDSAIYVITKVGGMVVLRLVHHFLEVFVVSVGEPAWYSSQHDCADDDDGVVKHI
jgi:hypothetical protein